MTETLEGMTGLERLKELAGDVDESIYLWAIVRECEGFRGKWGEGAGFGPSLRAELRRIAGMIERERALPEGVEWPRFEDGALVMNGDEFAGYRHGKSAEGVAYRIVFSEHVVRIESEDGAAAVIGCGERAKRPADTQERIDEGALARACDYWGCGNIDCSLCPAKVGGKAPHERYKTGGDCAKAQRLDLLRRQRELDAREAAR